MPNHHAHRILGGVAGGVAGLTASSGDLPKVLQETLGGILGGIVGAALSDLIDPPRHPRHRSIGHGVAPIAAGLTYALPRIQGLQQRLRVEAAWRRDARASSQSVLEQLWHLLIEAACRLLSGATVGVVAGYVAHVLMDSQTPAGLPLFA